MSSDNKTPQQKIDVWNIEEMSPDLIVEDTALVVEKCTTSLAKINGAATEVTELASDDTEGTVGDVEREQHIVELCKPPVKSEDAYSENLEALETIPSELYTEDNDNVELCGYPPEFAEALFIQYRIERYDYLKMKAEYSKKWKVVTSWKTLHGAYKKKPMPSKLTIGWHERIVFRFIVIFKDKNWKGKVSWFSSYGDLTPISGNSTYKYSNSKKAISFNAKHQQWCELRWKPDPTEKAHTASLFAMSPTSSQSQNWNCYNAQISVVKPKITLNDIVTVSDEQKKKLGEALKKYLGVTGTFDDLPVLFDTVLKDKKLWIEYTVDCTFQEKPEIKGANIQYTYTASTKCGTVNVYLSGIWKNDWLKLANYFIEKRR